MDSRSISDSHSRITLLKIIKGRHSINLIIVTSQVPVRDMYNIIQKKKDLADAILKRLKHQSRWLELNKESMKKKDNQILIFTDFETNKKCSLI